MTASAPLCATFWGSHGCDLPEGHIAEDGTVVHVCGALPEDRDDPDSVYLCSETRLLPDGSTEVRFPVGEPGSADEWSDWMRYGTGGLFRMDGAPVR